MDLRSSLIRILTDARKRSILHLLLEYLVLAATIILGGALVILLAGSAALSWFWLAAVAVFSLAAGLYLARKRFPSLYVVAQRIDQRLRLADTLSTAAYFLDSPGASDATVRESQRRQAEHLAESVDLKQAVPLSRPRAFYAALALAAAVAGILLVRYAVLGSFDAKAPLAQNAFPSVFGPPAPQPLPNNPDDDGNQPSDAPEKDTENAKNNDYAGEPPEDMNTPTVATPKDPGSEQSKQPDQQTENPEKMDQPQPANDQSQNKQNSQDGKQDAKQEAKSEQEQSMMDKLRQALNDMLNKMKQSPNDNAKNQKGDQQNQNDQQSGSDSQAEAKNSGEQDKKGADAKDGSSGQSKASPQQQSGAGKQEGEKDVKQAEAQKAMGKISELLGKRAENVKGMVMVEVGTTKQQLKTQVSQSQATHGEAGSEIHRDEIPPAYEDFVQQYFEQVRKTPAGGKVQDSAAAPAAQPQK